MLDITLGIVRAVLLAAVIGVILGALRRRGLRGVPGWGLILAGSALFLVGTLLDVSDEFPDLDRFVVLGNTPLASFLEKAVGYTLGLALLTLGLVRLIPPLARFGRREAELERANHELRQTEGELRQAAKALRESEERFRLAFHTSPDAVNINRLADGLYVEVNEGFTALTGYTRSDVVGRTSLEIDIWADPADRERLLAGLREHGVVRNLEASFRLKGGNLTTGLMSASVLQIDGVPHILSVTRDVQDWKLAQEALRESEQRFRALFEYAADAVFLHDEGGFFLEANSQACTGLGYTRSELLGMAVADVDPDALPAGGVPVWSGVRPGLPTTIISSHRRKDGSVFPVEVRVGAFQSGGQTLYLALARDMTERMRLESQLAHAQKMEAVGTLASGIAHDFNNLLQALYGAAELLLEEPGDSEQVKSRAVSILRASKRGSELVQGLLTFGRRQEPRLRVVDWNAELRQAVELLRRTIPKMVAIEARLEPGLGPVRGDPTQLQQMVMNLVANAAAAMPGGGTVTLETREVVLDADDCRGVATLRPGPHARLSVQDTGSGMEPEVLAQLFDPFYTTREVGEGTGLGMAIVYGIVQVHGGHIVCTSTPGEGTTFRIDLPLAVGEQPEGEAEEQAAGATGVPGAPRGGATVLLVDDEPAVREVVGTMLRQRGYGVLEAGSGEAAVDLYRARGADIDLVILDLGMPGMGGRRCLRELRTLDPAVRVLIATGYAADGQAAGVLEEGARDLIAKPYRLGDLARRVHELVAD